MHLYDLWFIAIAVLWAGYFLLEGFDFGVGILLPVLGRDNMRRRVLLNTIGPVWDGNEVWLLTAGGATFAAFPNWYASMFSAFYLPLLLVLVALIVRGVGFEYRGKRDSDRWRRNWDWAIFGGSLLPALLWGVAFGNIVRGIKLDAAGNYAGNFFNMLNPYALLGGLATLTLFTLHGAVFLSLKTTGDVRERAKALAWPVGIAAVLAGGAFLAWTVASYRAPGHYGTGIAAIVLTAVAAAALITAVAAARAGREGVAFLGTAVTIVSVTATLFSALFPRVLPSTINPAYNLTVANASSTARTLALMTVIAVIFLPLVLLYQSWTYWVFRKRIVTPATEAVTLPGTPTPGAPAPASGTPGEAPAHTPEPGRGKRRNPPRPSAAHR